MLVEAETIKRFGEHCLRVVAASELAVDEVKPIYRFLFAGLPRNKIHRLGKTRDIRPLHSLAVVHTLDIHLHIYSLRHCLLHSAYHLRNIVSVVFLGHVVVIIFLLGMKTDVSHCRHGEIFRLVSIYSVGKGVGREFLKRRLHAESDRGQFHPTVVDQHHIVCTLVELHHRRLPVGVGRQLRHELMGCGVKGEDGDTIQLIVLVISLTFRRKVCLTPVDIKLHLVPAHRLVVEMVALTRHECHHGKTTYYIYYNVSILHDDLSVLIL